MELSRDSKFKQTVARLSTATVEAESQSSGDPTLDQLVSAIAFLVYNTWNSLWMSVTDLMDNVSKRFPTVDKALETAEEIRFVVLNNSLVVNGAQISGRTRYVDALVSHLSLINAKSFSITRGITQEEFMWLLDALSSTAQEVNDAGGFTALIDRDGLKHVLVRTVKVEVVADDEIVVDKGDADADAVKQRLDAEERMLAALSEVSCQYEEEYVAGLQAIADDPGRMAELVLKATSARSDAEPPDVAVPKLAILIDCLERAFQGLIKHKSFKTKKGKDRLKKTLQGLEREVLARCDEHDLGDDARDQINGTVKHMIEGLNTSAVASDYVKKLKALKSSEKKVVDFIREQGQDRVRGGDLWELLEDAGLDRAGWNKLMSRGGGGLAEAGGTGSGAADADAIADMLARLETQLSAGEEAGEPDGAVDFVDGITEVSRRVNTLVEGTERKIQRLVELVGFDIDNVDEQQQKTRDEGLGPAISRRELVQLLAEIVCEMYQPLAMIRCSIETVRSNAVGKVLPVQMEMLGVASEGISRIDMLIQCLGKISDITPN